MKQKLVYQSPRMQSIELSSRSSLLSASGADSPTVGGPSASLNAMTKVSFQ